MKHYIIYKDGEQQVVRSLAGYADFTLIDECDGAPEMFQDWDAKTKKFVKNKAKADEAERKARCRDPEVLMTRIEALEARLAALEGQIGSTPQRIAQPHKP